ncbi:MAG: rhombosortase [Planctomycetota bacterium]
MNLPVVCGDRSNAGRRVFCRMSAVANAAATMLGIAPVTSLIAGFALLLQMFPELQPAAEFRFADLCVTGIWRLATSHLLHWSWDHFFWDTIVLIVAGAFCEVRWPRRFQRVLLTAILIIPVAVMISVPHLLCYRGLSGLDSALFALAASSVLIEEVRAGRKQAALAAAVVVAAQFLKIGLESAAEHTLFVQDAPFIPVPLSHLCGAVIGSLGAACGVRGQGLKVASTDTEKENGDPLNEGPPLIVRG